MSLFRGIADDKKLQDWLEQVHLPGRSQERHRPISCAGARASAAWKCCWAAPPPSPTCTISRTWWRRPPRKPACAACWARPSSASRWPTPKRPPMRCTSPRSTSTRFRDDPLVVPAVAPHALYTNSDETLKAARALANKFDAPLMIHLSETKKENDDVLAAAPHDAHRRRSIRWACSAGAPWRRTACGSTTPTWPFSKPAAWAWRTAPRAT